MRVLVTGGAGFIGANLLYHWAERHPEDELATLDALTYAGHLESIRPLLDSGRIRFVHGDIADPAVVREAVRGIDTIVHLAAESHVDRSIEAPAPFVRTNVVGTQVLLDAARASDVRRFHHVSTDEVFGSLPLEDRETRFTATTPYDPRSPYSATKAGADHLVRAYLHTYGLPVTISNCGNNYGPYQHPEKLVPKAITRLLNGQQVPLYGDGRNVRDWIFVGDHCRALDLIVQQGRTGSTYLIAGEGGHSNRELVGKILAVLGLGEERIEYVADRPGHDLRYALDASPSLLELGWRPQVGFEEGLTATIEWYRSRRDWWEPLAAPERAGR
ncbi:MAG: dTDP-glucose 4,6-dehydratase [Thermoplasmata archaeon]|nr:dTDP-glucose 4,6-dehydratase [Thermoplasmata archaeon]